MIADIDWQLAFPHAIVEVLPPHASDHNPMLLSCTKYKSKHAKLFHFQVAWITHPDYEALVYNTWSQTAGDAIAKLGSVSMHSITFNRDTFGNIFKKKRRLEARIKGIHTQLDLYPSSDLIHLEKDLQLEFSQVLEEEELLWFQKSQENWVKFGNKNTKFYHAQTVIHRRRNKVTSLQIDGIWCTDEDVLKGARAAFFKNLFQTSDTCVPDSLHLNSVPHIDSDLYALLVQPVSRREVRDALFSMAPYKTPGPDGFQPVFFRTYWNIVAQDVWDLVARAFSTGYIDPSLAETLIVPIPKVDEPRTLRDFRPISLCNVLLKLISKVLVRRVRPFLDDLIGPLQSSFIPNRALLIMPSLPRSLFTTCIKRKEKLGTSCLKLTLRKPMTKWIGISSDSPSMTSVSPHYCGSHHVLHYLLIFGIKME